MPIFLANDHYEGFLQTTYNPGESVFALDNLPLNVPTIVVSAPGTEYEAVFTVTGKTINALTGVARIRGYNGVLVEGTAITCLNNEEFINQYRTYLGIDWKGDWDNATAYAIQDGVAYNNTSYVAIQAGTNHLPTDTDYWQIVGVQGSQGIQGEPGTNGLGVPDGGATGEVLKKKSGSDNDTEWGTIVALPPGGTITQILAKASNDDGDAEWVDKPQGTTFLVTQVFS